MAWAWLLMFWSLGTIIMAATENAQAFATSALSQTITNAQSEIPVTTLAGFKSSGLVVIGEETLYYSSTGTGAGNCPDTGAAFCFVDAVRGVSNTQESAHAVGRRVYNETGGIFDSVLGYQIAETMGASAGILSVLFKPILITMGIYKVLAWDWPVLSSVAIGQLVRIPLTALSLAFLFKLWQTVTSAGLFGLFRRA